MPVVSSKLQKVYSISIFLFKFLPSNFAWQNKRKSTYMLFLPRYYRLRLSLIHAMARGRDRPDDNAQYTDHQSMTIFAKNVGVERDSM